ncbi:MAG: tRNA (adenosine(37)-N6)-threonylcarbamoyltransferase complex dimerization subunit type 1 TsaB [Defluviitaleaceae bacterium]|nr:tRNA (adenosine(37)-N6)-threonylcarbamoyltransferase complex dimerization subunit type 1 TsaB [Defluviitaleaceae bacterium]
MKILSIDTSGQAAGLAIISAPKSETEGNGKVIAEFTLNDKINHSVTIMPLLQQMLKAVNMEIADMDYIASASGPGSFTGLRIGASIAKALAHASDKRLVPVSTLLGLAYNVLVSDKIIVPIMDAKRNQVYAAAFVKSGDKFKTLLDTTADDIINLAGIIKTYDKPAVFVGCGVFIYKNQILDAGFEIAPENCNLQRASSIGLAAVPLIKQGADVNYNEFEINYARKPQAERELGLKNGLKV